MTIKAANSSEGNMFTLSEFGFGIKNADGSAYYESLFNNDTFSENKSNSSIVTLDAPGLLLPENQFLKFANLLAIATNGASDCVNKNGG